MSLKAEFRKFIKTKPVPPYATLPKSGIDVEWNDLLKAWKIDMGMDVNEFLTMFSPEDIHDVKTTSDGGEIYYTVIYNFLEYIDDSDWVCGTNLKKNNENSSPTVRPTEIF